MMVRYLIKKQQICKEIAFIQRKYSGLDVTLEQWKRIFSDFWAFARVNQAEESI